MIEGKNFCVKTFHKILFEDEFYISTYFLHFDAVTDHREDLNRKKNSFFWIKHRTSIVDSNALYFDSDPDPEICPNLDLNPSLFP